MSFKGRISEAVQEDFQRQLDFLAPVDYVAALLARSAIERGYKFLEEMPFACRKPDNTNAFLRELVIPFGNAGYVPPVRDRRRAHHHHPRCESSARRRLPLIDARHRIAADFRNHAGRANRSHCNGLHSQPSQPRLQWQILPKVFTMATMNISLADPLKQFVDEEAIEDCDSSTSDYRRDVIRERQKRKAEDRLRQLLAEGLVGPSTPVTHETFEQMRVDLRERFARAKR